MKKRWSHLDIKNNPNIIAKYNRVRKALNEFNLKKLSNESRIDQMISLNELELIQYENKLRVFEYENISTISTTKNK